MIRLRCILTARALPDSPSSKYTARLIDLVNDQCRASGFLRSLANALARIPPAIPVIVAMELELSRGGVCYETRLNGVEGANRLREIKVHQ